MRCITALVLPMAWISVNCVWGIEVSGRVKGPSVTGPTKQPIIVYAEALDSHTPPKPGSFTMAQKDKAFVPHILAIPVGSKVDFPNYDAIFHNVFTQSEPGRFNLGMYRSGQWRTHVFADTGVYHLFCKIHPQMAAIILVLPTSYIVQADASGHYHLDLPPGRFRLTAWSDRNRPASSEVTVTTEPLVASDLALGAPVGSVVALPK